MKKILSLSLLTSALVLSACGGSSDSSGNSNTNTYTKVLANKNEYSCPTQTAQTACSSDSTCKAASCTLTKQVVTPVDTTTTTACEVTATNVYGKNGTSCKYVATNANAVLTCSSGTLYIDGKIGGLISSNSSYGSGFTDGNTGIRYSCK